MWPVTKKFPKYRESYIIVLVDKYCAILEFFSPNIRKLTGKIKRK